MLEVLWLLLTTVLAWARPRHDLVLENLLLRHQLAVLTRPTRSRLRPPLHTWDKLVWVLAHRCCAGWREHLRLVTPDTVVRWHRLGWRLFRRWKSPEVAARSSALRCKTSSEPCPARTVCGAPSGSEASCSSWALRSAIVPFGATAGVDQGARQVRPGAPSCATTLIT